MKTKKKICSGLLAAMALMPGYALAAYSSDSETGVDALDYIENQHRQERQNRPDAEQQQLLKDTAAMQGHLRKPVDPQKIPTAFEGDDLTYDERTGDFTAKGHVRITQLDNRRFTADQMDGNTKKQQIEVPGKAHILQLSPAAPTVKLDGYKTNYNYGTKTGSMEDAKGKVEHQYVTGKRFEFYPDHIVIYDGTATKCSAKKPDYHTSADKIEYWPGKKMVLHHVKFWLGHIMLYRKNLYEVDLRPEATQGLEYPRVGYDSDDGIWIRKDFSYSLANKVSFNPEFQYMGKYGVRSSANLDWKNAESDYKVVYGYYEDSNNHWVRKQPSFIYEYGNHIGKLPIAYGLKYEFGRWASQGIRSNHTEYDFSLTRDPIHFNKGYTLHLGAGYSITRESYNDSRVDGFNYDVTLTKDFDSRWAAYTGYHYANKNSQNALFQFDTDDYSRKLENGFSYRFDDLNRIVVGTNYDLDGKHLKDIDYYWYHDIHCAQLILRYREKRHTWHVSLQFTPW